MTSTTAAARPLQLDSDTTVRAALHSPRRLRTEVIAGLVVALALIPEAISFSIIAGWTHGPGCSLRSPWRSPSPSVGGRPAMISAATGAVTLVIAPVVREHWVDYLIATVLVAMCCRSRSACSGWRS